MPGSFFRDGFWFHQSAREGRTMEGGASRLTCSRKFSVKMVHPLIPRRTRWTENLGDPNLRAVRKLLAKLQLFRDRLVAIGVCGMQVIEQSPALADHHQQPTTRAVIFLIALKMLRELVNPVGQ